MLRTELIVICGNYILLDDDNLPWIEIKGEKAIDQAKALMKLYLGLNENWYTLVQCGYFDDQFINNERIQSVIYVTTIPERITPKCNLAGWETLLSVSNQNLFNKIAFATKVTIPENFMIQTKGQ